MEEMQTDNERMMNGEEPRIMSENSVNDVPGQFNSWISDNENRITKTKSLPYFLKDNAQYTFMPSVANTASKSIKEVKVVNSILTPQEIADKRHGNRADYHIVDIKERWQKGSNMRAVERELGVEKGLSMSFEEANELKGNINFGKGKAYDDNCQCCIAVHEARLRGLNVTAQPNYRIDGSITHKLSYKTEMAWIDPKTGNAPTKVKAGGFDKIEGNFNIKYKTLKTLTNELNEYTKEIGRYHIDFGWKSSRSGHIITLDRLSDGMIRIYDPQNGKIISWNDLSKNISLKYGVNILKVDQLLVDTNIIKSIVTKL